ncbi:hypothetical protein U9397_21405 [Escherichia coli]|nr:MULTISPECIES: hypothetical protein [Escherichia]EGJ0197411.1 hypothetical protein [Escherichia coli]EGY9776894.1 hypothetical protein [Escherichia coli]EHB5925306.1 hypothetical protein [Escherichia coli]EHD1573859.1 hypothetical protein [Escherichia coli]EHE8243981.1 hypothetical protein [Escherichia coli]
MKQGTPKLQFWNTLLDLPHPDFIGRTISEPVMVAAINLDQLTTTGTTIA